MARSVSEAAASGDVRAVLEAMRDDLAVKLERAEPAVAAQLAGQLRAIVKDLAAMPAAKVVPKRDDLRARREARRVAGAAAESPASKGGRQRR